MFATLYDSPTQLHESRQSFKVVRFRLQPYFEHIRFACNQNHHISKMGLREIEWVKFNMNASESHMLSGKIRFAPFPENGRIYRWPFHPSASACSTHTGSPTFARRKRYAASLAIQERESSRSSVAQKNRLQCLWIKDR